MSSTQQPTFNKTSVTLPAATKPQAILEESGTVFCIRGYHNFNKVLKALEPFNVTKDMITDWKKCHEEIETPENFSDDFMVRWTQFRADADLTRLLTHDKLRPLHFHEHPILQFDRFMSYLLYDEINIAGVPIEIADRDNMKKMLKRALPGLKDAQIHFVTKGIFMNPTRFSILKW